MSDKGVYGLLGGSGNQNTVSDYTIPTLDISVRSKIIGKLFFNSRKINLGLTGETGINSQQHDNQHIDDTSKRLLDRDVYKPAKFFSDKNFFYKHFNKLDERNVPVIETGTIQDPRVVLSGPNKAPLKEKLSIVHNPSDAENHHMSVNQLIINSTNQIRRVVDVTSNAQLADNARERYRSIFEGDKDTLRISVDWA